MTDIGELQKGAGAARRSLAEADDGLAALRGRLRSKQRQLEEKRRQGMPGSEEQAEIKHLEGAMAEAERALAGAKIDLEDLVASIPEMPWDLVQQLPDGLPFLLLPVRIEARFMPGPQLWVRAFPDEVAVSVHERGLTASEVSDGRAFWREMWAASRDPDETGRAKEQGAWAALAQAYGGGRAAWIAAETRPATLDVPTADDLSFPNVDPDALKPESWSRAPRTRVMPDRFVVMGYLAGEQVFRIAAAPVPDPLILGPDPLKLESEYVQEAGELRTGPDFAWTSDFDEAIRKGMGLRIPLDPAVAESGLDRLLVLGLRLSSDASESQHLVEALFDDHHFSPGGMSLVPQGTPTNNTDGQGSGPAASDGTDPAESFALELGPPGFEPVSEPLEKTDAQRLAEALGIAYAPLQHLARADRRDWREARLFNTALFPATLGYYLEEMLDLDLATVGRARDFFLHHVAGRGPLPALRVGNQPYGVLLTSDFSAWQWSEGELGREAPFFNGLLGVMRRVSETWRRLAGGASRIGASADPYEDLLRALGLNPASLEFYRRHTTGKQTLWNFYAFAPGAFYGRDLMAAMRRQARALLQDLGLPLEPPPRIFDLAFFQDHDQVLDPVVDDITEDEREALSETKLLRRAYRVPDPADPESSIEGSYLHWLVHSSYDDLRAQRLQSLAGEHQPAPRALLYRLLRSALLLAVHDAATRLYARFDVLPLAARREIEIANVAQERTVTRWELMDAEVGKVLPDLSEASLPVGAWLLTPQGRDQPEALTLDDARRALAGLVDLPTARLERVFVEHLDTCSYRLDAWQMGCFARRLELQRFPSGDAPAERGLPPDDLRQRGLYLGAFGWLENFRPAPPPQRADLTGIPRTLHDPETDGDVFEQPEGGGFIHGPSLNHAVAAAVLRGAYLTHFDPAQPEKMAVNLSSARVRAALSFLEGVRNGQELGALLGYQFERGLHDNHGDPSLNQYLPAFRAQYPLLADKITPDASGSIVETKEARDVLDGYALVEAAFLRASPLAYPYGVAGLPADAASPHAIALQAEVARLADSLDAIADLLLAEGVFQVTQGNFERAAASLKTLTEGGLPPDSEIARTPRSGAAITQRVVLHLRTGGVPIFWPGPETEQARAEPGLNRWLGERLPTPDRITFQASWDGHPSEEHSLAGLGLQPLDLVLLAGDEMSGQETELEKRLAYALRRAQNNDGLQIAFEFMAAPLDPAAFNLFELLPLVRSLRRLVTAARPLSAVDFRLPSEVNTDPAEQLNPQAYDLAELEARVRAALDRFNTALGNLAASIPLNGEGNPVLGAIIVEPLRSFILALTSFGLPDAVPVSAAGDSDVVRQSLAEQGMRLLSLGAQKLANANAARAEASDASLPADRRLASYRLAVQEIFGPSYNLVPRFTLSAQAEVQAAAAFRDLPPDQNLTRFHQSNPLLVDEWLQGAARARGFLADLEQIFILSELFTAPVNALKPLQLPYRPGDHWVAVEFPAVEPEQIGQAGVFYPQGEFVSLLQCLPDGGFDPAAAQSGLMVDEWSEVIPGPTETTGIAVHYNQPGTEPPQALLLAVTPQVTGQWTWAKLEGILLDTMGRARQRAVEPDLLGGTAYGHLLPAVLSAVTSRRFGTITMDLLHATAVRAEG